MYSRGIYLVSQLYIYLYVVYVYSISLLLISKPGGDYLQLFAYYLKLFVFSKITWIVFE